MLRATNERVMAAMILGCATLAGLPAAAQERPTLGIWASADHLRSLPMSGPGWDNVKSAADHAIGVPNISNQDDDTDVYVFARALVYVRTGVAKYRNEVITACQQAIGTEAGGRTLALGRNLGPYVLAADLVVLPAAVDASFSAWIRDCLTRVLDGKTLIATHEERPNNWGTHAGASRMAVARYLRDDAELARAAQVFKGWLGDRAAYAGFSYGSLSWQFDASKPVGINPKGATKSGHNIDGVLPDDQRRGGSFAWPPPKENYVYEGLQGALAQAVILHRAGYDSFAWQDQALRRAFVWLHEQCNYPASGDDTWQPHLVNHYYGTAFPAPSPSSPGKSVGYTEWTHAGFASAPPPPSGPTSLTVAAVADAKVRSNYSTRNYGGETTLRVKSTSKETYRSYLKFDVAGISGAVTSAKVRVYVTDASVDGGSIHAVGNGWSEMGITWSNAPAIAGGALDSHGAVSSGTWIEFDVTSAIAGNGLFSFALKNASSDSAYFSSREGANAPELVVIFAGP